MKDPELNNRSLRTLWFGYRLMEYRAAENENIPAINIPKTVDETHTVSRTAGRSSRPMGQTKSHYEGLRDLIWWLKGPGKAEQKLKSAEEPRNLVIGVGFVHLSEYFQGRKMKP